MCWGFIAAFARSPVTDPLNIFDNSWLFNVTEGIRGIDGLELDPEVVDTNILFFNKLEF